MPSLFRGNAAIPFFAVGVFLTVVALCLTWMAWRTPSRKVASPGATGARPATGQTDAQEFYLRGCYYRNLRTRDGLTQAVDAFTQAVVRDSNYAPAYAGLAESYVLMPEFSTMPRSEAFPRAIAAANKALALDPNLPQAHAALAFALFFWDWNVPRSFAQYRRALELDPRNAEARHWYATSLLSTGNFRESLVQIRQAQEIDPASRSILADEALIEYSAGDRLAAISKLREIEREEPDFLSAPRYLSRLYLEQGEFAAFVAESKRVAAISNDPEDIAVSEAAARGFSGREPREMLEQIRRVLLNYFQRHLSSGFDLARTCALLGRVREAVTFLKAAYADRDYRVMSISLDDWTASLSDAPDFKELQARVRKCIDGNTEDAPSTTDTPSSLAQSE
jgi:tetratricopeptide (TPR) repeat protein